MLAVIRRLSVNHREVSIAIDRFTKPLGLSAPYRADPNAQGDEELLATQPPEKPRLSHTAAHGIGHHFQNLIPGWMPLIGVDPLEVVDVNDEDGARGPLRIAHSGSSRARTERLFGTPVNSSVNADISCAAHCAADVPRGWRAPTRASREKRARGLQMPDTEALASAR